MWDEGRVQILFVILIVESKNIVILYLTSFFYKIDNTLIFIRILNITVDDLDIVEFSKFRKLFARDQLVTVGSL
jgi:hypothetical protein